MSGNSLPPPPPPLRYEDMRNNGSGLPPGPIGGFGNSSGGGYNSPAGSNGYGRDDRRAPLPGHPGAGLPPAPGGSAWDDRRGPVPPPREGYGAGYGGGRRSPDYDGANDLLKSEGFNLYLSGVCCTQDENEDDLFRPGMLLMRDHRFREMVVISSNTAAVHRIVKSTTEVEMLEAIKVTTEVAVHFPICPSLSSSSPPPSPNSHHSPTPSNRPIMDSPHILPYLVTLRYFTDWLRASQPLLADSKDALDEQWQKYKNDFMRKGHTNFFEEWKDSAWFRERYEATKEAEESRKEVRMLGRKGKLEVFLEELEAGKLSGVSFDLATEAAKTKGEPAKNGNGVATNGESSMESDEKAEGESEPKPKEEEEENKSTKVELGPEMIQWENDGATLEFKSIPPNTSRKDLEEHCRQAPGFQYLALSNPNQFKKMARIGWAKFSSVDDLPKALELLGESKLGEIALNATAQEKVTTARLRIAPAIMNTPERISKDLEQIRLVVKAIEKEAGDTRGSTAIEVKHKANPVEGLEGDALAALEKKTLDLYLHYLRSCYNSCYYCRATHDFQESLLKKCPGHVRRTEATPAAKKPLELEVVKNLDEKLPLLMSLEEIDICDFGGEDEEAETHRSCQNHIKQEEEGKFRCKECNKLFSALKFIEKHLMTKHAEVMVATVNRVARIKYFNNYVSDPTRLPLPEREQRDNVSPQKPDPRPLSARLDDRPLGNGPGNGNKRRRGNEREERRGPPPPPPAGAVLDPRAGKGRQSYADLDGAPSGAADELVLPY